MTTRSSQSSKATLGWLLVVAHTGLLLTACGKSGDETITAANSQYQAADDAPQQPATSGNSSPVSRSPAGNGRSTPPTNPSSPSTSGQSRPAQPPSIPANQLNSFKVPDGDAQELLKFITQMDDSLNSMPRPQSREQEMQFMARVEQILNAKSQAAEKILAGKADDTQRLAAVNAKLDALSNMIRMQKQGVGDEIRKFCTSLLGDKSPDVARLGRIVLFSVAAGEFASGQEKTSDVLFQGLEELLADEARNRDVLDAAQQAFITLNNTGHTEEAKKIFKLTAESFSEHEDAKLAREAKDMLQQIAINDLGFEKKLAAILRNEADAAPAFLDVAKQALAVQDPGQAVLQIMVQSVELLEQTRNFEECNVLITSILDTFENHSDEELREISKQSLELPQRRMALMGQPFTVTGKLMDGSDFDWSAYQGKVVLVDFWATWCGPCIEEIPNMKKNYEQYKDKGFEIVGINIDQQRQAVTGFLTQMKLPWITVVSGDPVKQEMAEKCGVETIPFMLLVDRKGNVIDMHVRGENLDKALAQLLGDAGEDSSSLPPGEEYFYVSTTQAPVSQDDDELPPAGNVNPYAAPADFTVVQLVNYLLDMEEKPRSIRNREGFAEAVVDAANRVLAGEPTAGHRAIAALAKFQVLHRKACFGDEAADKALMQFVAKCDGDEHRQIAERVKFFQLERRVIEADQLSEEQIKELLAQLEKEFAELTMGEQHLRVASSTVRAINQLKDGDLREAYFAKFGNLFANSEDKQLAAYGKKLAKSPGKEKAGSNLVGQPLELDGVTADGTRFDWASYRGQVVVVDFWATWCGPCLREMPHLKAMQDKLKDQGLAVVGVSLDRDLDKLGRFLEENDVPWTNLAGEETQQLASKYGVRAIPTMMLIDKQGNVAAVAHRISELEGKAAELLK